LPITSSWLMKMPAGRPRLDQPLQPPGPVGDCHECQSSALGPMVNASSGPLLGLFLMM